MLEIVMVVVLIAILMAIAIPNLVGAQNRSQASSCIENLKIIERAKQQWAVINKKGAADSPSKTDLTGAAVDGILKTFPTCPAGGAYVIGDMTTRPTCSRTDLNHVLPQQN